LTIGAMGFWGAQAASLLHSAAAPNARSFPGVTSGSKSVRGCRELQAGSLRSPEQIDSGRRAVRHYDGCGLFFNNATADTNTSKPPNVQTIAPPDGKSL
jgi:hypothetical protein